MQRSLWALLAKELRVIRIGVVIGLPINLLQAITFLKWDMLGYVSYMASGTSLLALAGTIVDDRFRMDPFFASLPIRRELVVAARYLWCGLAIALMLGLIIGESRALEALGILRPRASALPATLGASEAVLFLLATALPLSLFLPFHYRWGLGAGAARFSMAAVGVALLGAGAGLVGRAAGRRPAVAIGLFLQSVMAALGPAVSVLLTVLLLAALGCVSCLLSFRFYARRDL